MSKRDAIVFDCDEVLLNWISGFLKYHNETYHTKVKGVCNYVFNRELGIDVATLQKRIDKFNASWQFGALKAPTNVVSTIKNLSTKHKEIAKIVVTRCGTSECTKQLRLLNLFNSFGIMFTDVYFLQPDESKFLSLQKIKRSYNVIGFIDDCLDNVIVGEELEIPSYLIRTQYNQYEHSGNVVQTVQEFIDAVIPKKE